MAFSTEFQTCLVCGWDVLTKANSKEIPMCSTHSDIDKLRALQALEERVNYTRSQIQRRGGQTK